MILPVQGGRAWRTRIGPTPKATLARRCVGRRIAAPPSGRTGASVAGNNLSSADEGGPPRLEVRWIRAGEPAAGVLQWFNRFPTVTESRADDYLIRPDLVGLSAKIRGGGALEVKVYRGSPGWFEVPGCARGVLEYWQRWSFPVPLAEPGAAGLPSWKQVRKVRRTTFLAVIGGRLSASRTRPEEGTVCAVELAQIEADAMAWWSLGFEAMGVPEELGPLLHASAATVFHQLPPEDRQFSGQESGSYQQWLRTQYGGSGSSST
ncbi:MAG: hypothetical protein JWO63_2303 [Frankiales bacterium]|nr:hypothetical protein [Frankiales bacterium]